MGILQGVSPNRRIPLWDLKLFLEESGTEINSPFDDSYKLL
jgi:hypothetical protein